MTKVSVLVAVYNTADYLPQCLDSLLAQTMIDIEVLCVDDGSTDASPAILQQYAERDQRVKPTFLKENTGLAHARNVALRQATGEYVCFVDSDDWLATDALEKVYDTFEDGVDTVLFRVVLHFTDGREQEYKMKPFETLTGEEAFKESLTWKIHGVYAVRRELHQLFPYDETLKAYSDENVTHIHYLRSRIVKLCDGTYFYRQHGDSVTHRASVRRFDSLLAKELLRNQLINIGASSDVIRRYENVRWLNLVGLYFFYYLHREELSMVDRLYGQEIMKHVWQSIDIRLLDNNIRRKFGYIPFRCSWKLFCMQEELYFWLRGCFNKNIEQKV